MSDFNEYKSKINKALSEVVDFVPNEHVKKDREKNKMVDQHKKTRKAHMQAQLASLKANMERMKQQSLHLKTSMQKQDEIGMQQQAPMQQGMGESVKRGRPSQAHPIAGHDYHRKSDAELRYIAKDAGEAARALRGVGTGKSENKYQDQMNDAHSVLHFRRKGMPDWYKKKYGHVKEETLHENDDPHGMKKHLSDYDMRQWRLARKNPRRYHNPYALSQYHDAADKASAAIKGGMSPADAINKHFVGQLARHLHKKLKTGGTDTDTMRRKHFGEETELDEKHTKMQLKQAKAYHEKEAGKYDASAHWPNKYDTPGTTRKGARHRQAVAAANRELNKHDRKHNYKHYKDYVGQDAGPFGVDRHRPLEKGSKKKGFKKNWPYKKIGGVEEETEPLDELSRQTLYTYKLKARDEVTKNAKGEKSFGGKAKTQRKRHNRIRGMGRASDREKGLFSRGARRNPKTGELEGNKYRMEETENLDELSRETLSSYKEKNSIWTRRKKDEMTRKGHARKMKNLNRADDRLSGGYLTKVGPTKRYKKYKMEETEPLDELKQSTLKKYVEKAAETGRAVNKNPASRFSLSRKARNSQRGISRALKRISGKFDHSPRYAHPDSMASFGSRDLKYHSNKEQQAIHLKNQLKKVEKDIARGVKEETELAELKKSTLRSYITKSFDQVQKGRSDYHKLANDSVRSGGTQDVTALLGKGRTDKLKKRNRGIDKARKRMSGKYNAHHSRYHSAYAAESTTDQKEFDRVNHQLKHEQPYWADEKEAKRKVLLRRLKRTGRKRKQMMKAMGEDELGNVVPMSLVSSGKVKPDEVKYDKGVLRRLKKKVKKRAYYTDDEEHLDRILGEALNRHQKNFGRRTSPSAFHKDTDKMRMKAADKDREWVKRFMKKAVESKSRVDEPEDNKLGELSDPILRSYEDKADKQARKFGAWAPHATDIKKNTPSRLKGIARARQRFGHGSYYSKKDKKNKMYLGTKAGQAMKAEIDSYKAEEVEVDEAHASAAQLHFELNKRRSAIVNDKALSDAEKKRKLKHLAKQDQRIDDAAHSRSGLLTLFRSLKALKA